MRKAMLTCLLMLAVFAAAPVWGDALRLSVTTDLEASGLLDVLAPEFKKPTIALLFVSATVWNKFASR